MARMFASRFPWESSTPLGSPVLPEVYWINAGSPGSPRSAAPTSPGRARSGAATTCRSDGTRERSSVATRRASGKVMMARAAAFRRMPTWRRA